MWEKLKYYIKTHQNSKFEDSFFIFQGFSSVFLGYNNRDAEEIEASIDYVSGQQVGQNKTNNAGENNHQEAGNDVHV